MHHITTQRTNKLAQLLLFLGNSAPNLVHIVTSKGNMDAKLCYRKVDTSVLNNSTLYVIICSLIMISCAPITNQTPKNLAHNIWWFMAPHIVYIYIITPKGMVNIWRCYNSRLYTLFLYISKVYGIILPYAWPHRWPTPSQSTKALGCLRLIYYCT